MKIKLGKSLLLTKIMRRILFQLFIKSWIGINALFAKRVQKKICNVLPTRREKMLVPATLRLSIILRNFKTSVQSLQHYMSNCQTREMESNRRFQIKRRHGTSHVGIFSVTQSQSVRKKENWLRYQKQKRMVKMKWESENAFPVL